MPAVLLVECSGVRLALPTPALNAVVLCVFGAEIGRPVVDNWRKFAGRPCATHFAATDGSVAAAPKRVSQGSV